MHNFNELHNNAPPVVFTYSYDLEVRWRDKMLAASILYYGAVVFYMLCSTFLQSGRKVRWPCMENI